MGLHQVGLIEGLERKVEAKFYERNLEIGGIMTALNTHLTERVKDLPRQDRNQSEVLRTSNDTPYSQNLQGGVIRSPGANRQDPTQPIHPGKLCT